jgi:hypothetical protein
MGVAGKCRERAHKLELIFYYIIFSSHFQSTSTNIEHDSLSRLVGYCSSTHLNANCIHLTNDTVRPFARCLPGTQSLQEKRKINQVIAKNEHDQAEDGEIE